MRRSPPHPPSPIAASLCAALLLVALGAAPADAHTRSVSHSSWQLREDGARVKVRIPRLELTRVALDAPPQDPILRAQAADYLEARLALSSATGRCQREGPVEPRSAREGWAAFAWNFRCDGPPTLIETAILLDAAPSHLHFARLGGPSEASGQPERIVERVLTEENPAMPIPRPSAAGDGQAAATEESVGSSIAEYVAIGVEHILTGWDHVAFVLALLLLAARLGEVARLVTGFTVAHSVTLALAVLGVVRPRPEAVEALIGFSVALVAIESAWLLGGRPRALAVACVGATALVAVASLLGVGSLPVGAALGLVVFVACHFALLERVRGAPRVATLRAAIAFAFGLVHGFGFAGILAEMQLPDARLVPALFGFNVGVELGQLGIVALAWPALRASERFACRSVHRLVLDASCASICGLGVFWFVSRSFGL